MVQRRWRLGALLRGVAVALMLGAAFGASDRLAVGTRRRCAHRPSFWRKRRRHHANLPHWFAPRYRDYAVRDPPVDQHELLALIAPRPLLVAHAARDGWADPAGAYQAVVGARPVFDLVGGPSPRFAMRAGTHSITDEDWRLALDFLDASLR